MATAASSNTGLTLVSAGSFVHLLHVDGRILTSIDVLPISQAVPMFKISDGTERKEQLKFHDNFQIQATAFANNDKTVAVATSAKTVVIFNVQDGVLSEHRSFRIPKTPTALVFDRADAAIIVADRAGVVRKYSVDAAAKENKEHIDEDDTDETDFEGDFVCSAISMMLDVQFSDDGRYLLVTDRDEKLRIHRYPQTFVLHSLCMAHKDYVNTVCTTAVGEKKLAFTAGGDGVVIGWDYLQGVEMGRSAALGAVRRLRVLEEGTSTRLIALLNNSSTVVVLRVEGGEKIEFIEEKRIDTEGRVMDITVPSKEKIVVVSSTGLGVLSLAEGTVVWSELSEEHKKTLADQKDPIPDMTKKVAHDNMTDYLQRKHKKIEEGRNKKRKNGVESVSEPPQKKVNDDTVATEEPTIAE
ncbi:hypothetical protein PFISCL1PPCAC_11832 [Pristionchus fissidentatus]|uniref:tRNA (guanine-N(7)-)-methyltransferase non-catalytic subunit n=1 Tax=Pristionchus fissidentatus TaxID=1538716 RepID=A0AAV5VRB9_9BILA|nr:hypothetical protein PFISCL1PPCAC_11832 [Pristionchus fissidentatus]